MFLKTDQEIIPSKIFPLSYSFFFFNIFFWSIVAFFFFWPCCTTCGILVPRPGLEPAPLILEAQNLNHWTTREVSTEMYY